MRDTPRTSSAKSSGGSRRRRWEVRSKESFEASLAVEVDSPQRKTPHFKREAKREPSTDSSEDKKFRSQPKTSSSPPKVPSHKSEGDESDLLSSKLSALIEEASVKSPKESESGSPELKAKHQVHSHSEHTHKREATPQEPAYEKQTEENLKGMSEIKSFKDRDRTQVIDDKFETKSLKVAESPKVMMGTEESEYRASAPPLSPEQGEQSSKKKRKHKRKSDSKLLVVSNPKNESYISLQLKEMEEDVINVSRNDTQYVLSAPGLLFNSATVNPPGTISTIYQEKLGGFVITKDEPEGMKRKNEDLHDISKVPTRSSHAIFLQSGFRTFSVLCQGLLAGVALAHCLLIFLLESNPSSLPGVYPPILAHVFFALILFLTSICLVAAFDRCDLVGSGVFSGHGIKMPWTPALYISSMVLSLVAIRTENLLINYKTYKDSEVISAEKASDLVDWWRWVCVARTSLSLLAWLAVVPDPHTDALLDHLQEFHQKMSVEQGLDGGEEAAGDDSDACKL